MKSGEGTWTQIVTGGGWWHGSVTQTTIGLNVIVTIFGKAAVAGAAIDAAIAATTARRDRLRMVLPEGEGTDGGGAGPGESSARVRRVLSGYAGGGQPIVEQIAYST